MAIGNGAQANQTGAIAFGNNAIATGASAVAIGNGAQANQTGAIALGNNASAAGIGAMVIGQYNTAKGQNSLAFGGGYNDANKGNTASSTAAVAFGERSWAVSEGSVAFGYGTQAGNTITDKNGKYTGQNAVAFGNGTKALGGRSLAFGENTTANYNDSVAFGNGATAFSSGATAFGNRSRALSQYSTSFGDNSVAAGSMSFAFGTDTIAGAALDDNGALELTDGSRMDSYGNKAYTTTDTAGNKVTYSIKGMDIPSGVDVHDYVVVTGTKADGTTGTYVQDYQGGIAEVKVNADGTVTKVKDLYSGKLGGWYQYDENGKLVTNAKGTYVVTPSAKMTSIPVTLDKATPGSNGYTLKGFKNATAFGYSTEASGDNATAFGNDTKAKASAATAFGTTTTASGDNATAFGLSTTASGKQTTAFGSSTTASGDNATAFGENSTASGEAATAFGIGSTASGKNSLAALGGTASAENAAAIGNGAQATLADSVALGSNSKATRAKYIDLTVEKEKAAYAKYGSTGSAWEATDNAIAVGNDSTVTRQITGVAAGSLDTDAVNVAQLKAVDARHTTVSVGGQQAQADNAVVKGGNLEMTRTTSNGQANYDVSLNKDIVLGQQEENKGGSIVINSVGTFRKNDDQGNQTDYPMKEAVKIDGTTVSVVKHDGSNGGNDQRQVVLGVGQDTGGYVALYDNTGKKPTYIFNAISPGITYLKDKDSYLTPDPTNPNDERASNEFNRLEYGDYRTSTIQFIATLDDGQKYAGDNYQAAETETKTVDGKTTKTVTKEEQNVLLKKLNERLDIKGGADKDKLTEKNIGVNVDSTTGVMKVQLAQNLDLTDKGSVKMGNTTVSNGGVTITPTGVTEDTQKISLTDNGLSNGGKQITHVDSGLKDAAGNPVDLATAIGDVLNNAVNVGDLQNVQKVASAHTAVTVNGSVEAPAVAADGKLGNYTDKEKGNLLLAQKKDTTTGQITYDLKLNDNVILGKDGSDGKDGQEGTIGLTGKDGIPGTDGKQRYSTTIIKTEKGQAGADGKTGKENLAGTDMTRIVYTDKNGGNPQTVATMDDGQKYGGDNYVAATDKAAEQNVITKKLNERLDIQGGADKNKLTEKNIGVNVDSTTGVMKVQLAQNLDLTDKGSVKMGNTTVSNGGVTITPTGVTEDTQKISLTDNGLSNGGKQITHVDSGLKDAAGNPVDLATAIGDVLNNAVNVGDLQNVQKVASAHTAVTVNGSVEAPAVAADGKLGNYTDKEKGNLLLAQKKDTTTGQITYDLKLNDNVILGKDGSDGKDGQEGTIGLTGKDGIPGTDGKQRYSTTIIKTEKGQAGADGKKNLSGTDMTRIVYTDKDGGNPQIVATLSDGLKFAGDDISKTVDKKLNDTLQIRGDGTYNAATHKTNDDGNIKISSDAANGTIKVALSDKINLHQDGSLTVGGDKNGDAADGNDPILIKYFDAGDLTVTGTGKDGKTPQSAAGDYVTGLDNKDWNVDKPEYVSGRAATEDQLKEVSNAVTKATETAGKHTVVTVEGGKDAGTTNYNGENLKLKVTDTAGQKTYDLKLNDNLSLGTVGKDGEKGTDGSIGLKGADGKSSIGLNGRDGISVIGKDDKNGVSITGSNGLNGKDGIDGKIAIGTPGKDAVSISGQDGEGHIGLTGPAGKDGKDASADIHVKNGQIGVDGTDGNNGKDGMDRIVYDDHNGKPHEVATMDDGLKFVGNDDQEVTRKLNETLSIKGGLDKDAVAKASTKNLGVRQNATKDGLEIVMTDTPDFTKVTVGKGDDTTKKITIGEQPNTDTKNPANGNYITGLDNTKWDRDHVTENRAATEGQLRDIAGSITNQTQGGGFALTSDEKGVDKIVKQDLGKAIQIKGDTTYKTDGSVEKAGNIKTSIDNGAIKVGLNKDVDLGNDGSVSAGQTKVDKNGVDTNKITIKDSTISISKDGINGGSKQITDIASGASEIRDDGKGNKTYVYNTDTNAANIGDVKRIAGEVKNEVTNVTKNVTDVTNKVNQMGDQVTTVTKDVTQLKQDVKADRTYQGDDGAAKKVKVKFGSFLSLTGGAQLADLTEEGNIGVVQKEIDDPDHKDAKITGLSVRLAKHLNLEKTTYTSEENGQTYTSEIDGKGLTINTGDANRNITVQDGNVSMGGNQIHHVAPGQAPDDAVNVSQLNATNYAVNKLDTRVNRVGANAAALAALHPLDFDPDDKWDFSAGYGHYKDANAAAVGAFYRPNEDTMFSVGGSFGGGENMVNAGVSVKLGQGNHVSTSRVAMAKEIKDLKKDVAALKAVVNQQSALIDKLTGVNAGELSGSDDLFPDVPANHWAYEYVTRLKQAGILTGYPDGNFAGDRMMTRYEFAAIVYRAIMAGAAANPSLNKDGTLDRLSKEFSSEMKYIRIDTIRKGRNGRPTIQRVRVIKEDEKEK